MSSSPVEARGAQATSLETPHDNNVRPPGADTRTPAPATTAVCVALSGGPDSLALLACAVRAGLSAHAIVVDHALQPGSADIARRAADQAIELGAGAEVVTVTVDGRGGLESAARTARYAALDRARAGRPVLLGHTMDDQAETVLLGLARGSGARSLAGMRVWNAPWGRPLLGVRRADTIGVCAELGLTPFDDPHNSDPRFTRVRLRREALPLLDDILHGVTPALARTAMSLREDNDTLDALAATAYAALVGPDPRAADPGPAAGSPVPVPVEALAAHPPAIRRRVIRLWLHGCGVTDPTRPVIGAVDALVADWHGQGGVAIGGDPDYRLEAIRTRGVLTVRRTPRRG
ncbi:tRNA lysidine(34) synthetase TilS [Gordonia pseudamarae]|uniref:tRNA(Ile)-lysidine synthase n=1 Tax=Gordonia pseudamarae TaxID=2831662 RepID=A0ABX6IFM7_9ACTN|nr:tRNA lysidine(34) synthetase TilS [Gordonia pseudamarae]QHN34131.1 tRNA lysidine(34) synthetase TilS [Gordonia pseudamarae]